MRWHRHHAPHEPDRKPDYDEIARLEIELQDGPAWDKLQAEKQQEIARRAKEEEARRAEEDRIHSMSTDQIYRETAFEVWRTQEALRLAAWQGRR